MSRKSERQAVPERVEVRTATDRLTARCFGCKRPVAEDRRCFGCDEHVCESCDARGLVATAHEPDAHLKKGGAA